MATVVATNVYRLRVMKMPKWSQDRLAVEAGVGVNTIAALEAARDPERHQPRVRLDTIERLASALGVEPAELLRWDADTRAFLHGDPSKWIQPPIVVAL